MFDIAFLIAEQVDLERSDGTGEVVGWSEPGFLLGTNKQWKSAPGCYTWGISSRNEQIKANLCHLKHGTANRSTACKAAAADYW